MSADLKAILDPQRAFLAYVRETYVTHTVGALCLAVELYEGCRKHSDSFFWDIMATQGETWNSQSFLNAAKAVIAIAKIDAPLVETQRMATGEKP